MRRRGLWKPPGAAKGFRPPRISGATSTCSAAGAGAAPSAVPAATSQAPAPTAARPKLSGYQPQRRNFRPPTVAARPQGVQAGHPAATAPPAAGAGAADGSDRPKPCYFEVLYCKHSNKKRKTYMDGAHCAHTAEPSGPCFRALFDRRGSSPLVVAACAADPAFPPPSSQACCNCRASGRR